MRQEYDMDENLKEALRWECTGLTASPDLKTRIDERILKDRKEASVKESRGRP